MLRNSKLAGKLVSRIGLGTMRFTGAGIWGAPVDEAECIRALRVGVENGVNQSTQQTHTAHSSRKS